MRRARSVPSSPPRRVLGAVLALPLALVALVAVPADAQMAAPSGGNDDISVTGSYSPGGTGCQGADEAAHCLFWGVRIPDTVAPGREMTLTLEADSQPGQWTWNCPSAQGVTGIATLYTSDDPEGPIRRYGSSGLGLLSRIYNQYSRHGDYSASADGVSCSPEHLSLAYTVDFSGRPSGSYLDLSIGTLVNAPGDQARDYTLKPTLTTTEDATPHSPTATAAKEPASATHATVTTSKQDPPGDAAKDAGRYTATIHNDSTTALSGFTIAAARTEGPATITRLSCDLTAFGGGVVTAEGPATRQEISGGGAVIPADQEATCQVDLSGVIGYNTISTSVTAQDGKIFSSLYEDERARGEVSATVAQSGVTVQGPDATHPAPHVIVDYTVALSNTTDVVGWTPSFTLTARPPTGLRLEYAEPSGTAWWLRSTLLPDANGSIAVGMSSPLYSNSGHTVTLSVVYSVDSGAITPDGWKALGTCDPNDPSKGLSATIDVKGNDTIDTVSLPLCTIVTQARK
ncbi:hypothetical protein [Actinomyces gaoshouyii]|uniref:hypothetical protein n=1 Tax=Actinomyces gaoshouyii TaxID=1960083 RepID=UPI0009BDE8DF|nr:hypothetical protein [Actinomyces gaoshouyii]ARD41856.1 hypothetical protein B6G06_05480 [Actinomyces gaoshouyii]